MRLNQYWKGWFAVKFLLGRLVKSSRFRRDIVISVLLLPKYHSRRFSVVPL